MSDRCFKERHFMKKKIAIFTTGWCCEILSEFLTGMQTTLENENVDLFLFLCYPTHVDSSAVRLGETNIFSLPDLKGFDGVIIFGSGLDFKDCIDDILARSKAAGIPVIMQGGHREGTIYIGSDNYVATLDMCRHLSEKHGVRKIIFLAGSENSSDSELRLQAVKDYLAEQGRSSDLIDVFYTKWENAAADRYIKSYVTSGSELPDAFICANDGLAMAASVALSDCGYEVPDKVLVCGYDHIEESQIFDPAIASVDQCFSQMGTAAGELWLKIRDGAEYGDSVVIPCRFIPGDSCGCYETRNSDLMRRRIGRNAFSKRAQTTYFNRKLNLIDSTVLSCLTFSEFKTSLRGLIARNHDFEGDSFHILLEPNFGLSINDPGVKLRKSGYSKYLEVMYSTENGTATPDDIFPSRELVPGYEPDDDVNHLYTLLPLHEADEVYGYVVFKDCMKYIYDHSLQSYQSRMSLVFDKFRHALSLDIINKRLLDIMKKDPLTNVNNRMAYEDKEKSLQSEINYGSELHFAIVMFDVNNLKLVNDSMGHEAGDSYLIRSCRLICNVFKHSPVYRVGGDEFIAVLMGDDYNNRHELIETLKNRLTPYTDELPLPEGYISIACGMSEFENGTDSYVEDTLKRADEKMYENKAMIKGTAGR